MKVMGTPCKKGLRMNADEKRSLLSGKKILIVDDEEDILDLLTELLDVCVLERASSFEQASALLENNMYDAAVLDIMGVDGYGLLKIAESKNIPAIMLTAHALTKEDLLRSIKEGASYYAPKDKINRIAEFISDVLEARKMQKNIWARWFNSLGSYYDNRFGGADWREMEQEFWEERLKDWDSDDPPT